ncbi:YdcF family protein [Paraliomyxa miuraensis]|uniref:YdcF family protein n=1 Tax=Paraliomyxa miuraensis TaxID=376150 RepID=UPI00225ACE13|nr:YdcF family protein [Paraliomyxa miuraensis]MCX4247702.1 YdcF family protein [Paraliomyxa miuraensis]
MSDERRAVEDARTPEPSPDAEPLVQARRWRRLVGRLALAGSLLWVSLAFGLDRYGQSRPEPQGQWDAIVVLGCRVYPDGRASVALSRRVKAAAELYAAGRAETIVLTGGTGDSGHVEAEVAAEIAESLGVPRSALVLETRSTSTEENAEFAAGLIEGRRVVVVTDAYHVLRSERVFARFFDEVSMVGTVSPRWWPRSRGALREVLAIAGYALRGRL